MKITIKLSMHRPSEVKPSAEGKKEILGEKERMRKSKRSDSQADKYNGEIEKGKER